MGKRVRVKVEQIENIKRIECSFNHIVGLPVKDKVEHPIYDYEKILYDNVMNSERKISKTSISGLRKPLD